MKWCNAINMFVSDIEDDDRDFLCCDFECNGCEDCDDMDELKPCPFCGSEDIRYSINFERIYYAAMYCNKCNCYGSRILIKPTETNKYDVVKNKNYKQEALTVWNTRV